VITVASYKITGLLAKKMKKEKEPFWDGNVIKESLVVAGESLLNGSKTQTEICSAIEEAHLSRSTDTRGVECMSDDTEQQLR
jgi:hypothetical protein